MDGGGRDAVKRCKLAECGFAGYVGGADVLHDVLSEAVFAGCGVFSVGNESEVFEAAVGFAVVDVVNFERGREGGG